VNSSCAQADLQAAQKRKLPLITSLVTRTDLTDEYAKIAQKSPKEPRYFFQTAVSDSVRADALVKFIKRQMYPDNIASLKIFVERDSYGEGLRQDFDQLLKQSDARPEVSYGSYDPGFGDADQPIKDKQTRTIQGELRSFVIPDRKNWIGVFGLTTDFTEIARIAQELGMMRAIVELHEGQLRISIQEGLLVDATDALDRAHVVRILGAEITRMFGLDLPVGLFLFPRSFQRPDLIFGEDQIFLSGFGFHRFEPFAKGFQIVAQPNAAHPSGRDQHPALGQIVG